RAGKAMTALMPARTHRTCGTGSSSTLLCRISRVLAPFPFVLRRSHTLRAPLLLDQAAPLRHHRVLGIVDGLLTRVENPEAGAHGTGDQSRTAARGPHTTTAPQDGTGRTRQAERLGRTPVLPRTSLPVGLTDQPPAVFPHRGD